MDRRQAFAGVWPGLILVSLGGGLLAREFGFLPKDVRFTDFWPLLVVLLGISSLLRARGFVSAFFSLAFAVTGGVLLAGNLGFLTVPTAKLWPALLVLLGLALLLHRGHRPRPHGPRPPGSEGGAGAALASRGDGEAQVSDERLVKQLTFSGAQLRIESQAWKGGELGVTAGGVELDLRQACLHPDGAVLDLRVVMGGVDLRVPDTWQVHCDVTPFFGGADDTTRSTQGATTAPRLRVTGTVTLGGVTVRN
jgi:predicted membrane protein